MRAGNAPKNDAGPDDPASPLQPLIFVVMGPFLSVLIVWAIMMVTTGGPSDTYGYPVVFLFSLLLCAAAAPLDYALARHVSIDMRAILIAIAGAFVAVGTISLVVFPLPELLLMTAAFGALNTGTCSLLAYCFRRRRL